MHSLIPHRTLVSFVLLALLAACAPSPAAQTPAGPPPPPPVGVESAETKKLVEHAELTGRLGPVETVAARPRWLVAATSADSSTTGSCVGQQTP